MRYEIKEYPNGWFVITDNGKETKQVFSNMFASKYVCESLNRQSKQGIL
jgi:hypothetical protein